MRERNSIFVLSEFRPAMKKQQQQEQKKKKKTRHFQRENPIAIL